jgi:hypothetical protein
VEEETLAVNVGFIVEMIQPGAIQAARAPDESMDFIAFVQQELGQV